MILTPHAIVGAALANIFPSDPALGFGLAFLSHYVLDVLPHTDYDVSNFMDKDSKTVKSIFKNTGSALHFLFIIIDFVIAIFLCILFFVRDGKSLLLTFIGIIGGLLPDFFQFLYYKYKNQPWIFYQKIHDKLHHTIKTRNEKLLGMLFDLALPICILIFYFFIKTKI
jgi:hypothetical protein